MRLSVAIPLHNEGQVLPELLDRLRAVLNALPGGGHELIFVDDGSRDNTMDLLLAAAAADSRMVVVSLSRNFGNQAALTAALDQVSGDAVVVMDGDLQDAPEDIPRLLAKLDAHDRAQLVVHGEPAGPVRHRGRRGAALVRLRLRGTAQLPCSSRFSRACVIRRFGRRP